MSGNIAAVFDLDRTLTRVRSLESSFIRYLVDTGHVGPKNLLRAAWFIVLNVLHDPATAFKRNKMYLKGISLAEVDQAAAAFLESRGSCLMSQEGMQLVKQHKDCGHQTILVTGSPEFLVRPLINRLSLPFDHLYATRLKVEGERYSGEIDGAHYFGKEKETLVRTIAKDLRFSLAESFCYADSESDIPMMALFGKPVAVNPDKGLIEKSHRHEWQILKTV